jgi:hypothetical protein
MHPSVRYVLFAIAMAGCAVGTTGVDTDGGSIGDDSIDASTGDGAADSGLSTDDGSSNTDATGDDASTATDAAGDDASTNDASTDSGMADAGTDSGGTTVPCTSPNMCSNATQLGSISGDTTTADKTANGTTSQWFTVAVTEDDSGVLGVPMKLQVTLHSPSNENFDLYVYLGGSVGAVECTTVQSSSTNGTGAIDSVALTWGETGTFSNGSDDSRTVTIEVRAVSTCDSAEPWAMTVHGH